MAGLETGMRLAGRFVLEERLGDGGHAEVWAAFDETNTRRVALKFMHLRSCSGDEALRVLRHEAQMTCLLEHPGVLRVDDPQRDSGLVFLPMEFAGGGDAASLRGAPWRQVLPVLLQVARVLEHAHGRGVVHRDIKPGNILLDDDGCVRVADFGTASRTGSTLALSAGSPFSASPQQLRGDPATAADDVYGLGALAYELLSKHPPYYPNFDQQRVQVEDPAPLQTVHAAPAALLELVRSMLARSPEARPDLTVVIEQFSQLLDMPDAQPSPVRPPVFRKWGMVALLALFVLMIALALPALRDSHDRDYGARLEGTEQWLAAAAHYEAVLARDPTLEFARDGLIRSNRRSELDRELDALLAKPDQLALPAARDAARHAMARGEATRPQTPRLQDQLQRLEAALQAGATQ